MTDKYLHTNQLFFKDNKNKKKMLTPHRILAIAVTVALLFSMLPVLAMSSDGTSSDLHDFTNKVEITDLNGQSVSEYKLGENYIFRITFQEKLRLQFEYDDQGFLNYTLPENISFNNSELGKTKNIVGSNKEIGDYYINTDGRVYVQFNDVDNEGNSINKNFIDAYEDAFFVLEITAQFTGTGGKVQLDFGDGIKINVTVKEQEVIIPTPQLEISKSDSFTMPDNINDGVVSYSVTITARDGDVSDIWLRDMPWVTVDGVTYPLINLLVPPKIKITDLMSDITITFSDGTVTQTKLASVLSWVGNEFEIKFDDYTLSQNESITLTYSVKLKPVLEKYGISDLSDDYIAYDFTLWNSVKTNGSYIKDGTTLSVGERSTIVNRRFSRSALSKSGKILNDGKRVEWTIKAGNSYTKLNGFELIDTMGNGMGKISSYTVFLKGQDNKILKTLTVTLEPSDFGFKYTVPDDPAGVYYVEIIYVVDITNDYTPILKNSIEYGKEGWPEYEASIATEPPAGVDLTKSSKLIVDEEGNDYIEWTINFKIPKELYGQPIWLDDTLYAYPGKYQVENIPEDMSVTATNQKTHETQILSLEEDYLILTEGVKFDGYFNGQPLKLHASNSWIMYFGNLDKILPAVNAKSVNPALIYPLFKPYSLSPFEEDTLLIITYRTSLDSKLIQPQNGMNTLRDVMQDSYHKTGSYGIAHNDILAAMALPIEVEGDYITGETQFILKGGSNNPVYAETAWPIQKSGKLLDDGYTIDYTIRLDGYYLEQRITEQEEAGNVIELIFKDIFDKDMTYISNTFYIQKITKSGSNFWCALYDVDGSQTADLFTNYINSKTIAFDLNNKNLRQVTVGVDGKITSVGNTINISDWFSDSDSYYFIHYRMEVDDKDLYETGIGNVTNKAFIDGEHYTDSTMVQYGKKVVEKIMTSSGNTASVEIIINPLGLKLVDNPDISTIEVKDQMNDNLAFFLSTIKVETKDATGAWVTLDESNWSYVTSSEENSVIFTFPDEMPLRLTYTVLIKGEVNDNVEIINEIWVNGSYHDAARQNFEIKKSGAFGGGSTGTVILEKKDFTNNHPLPKVEFALYRDSPVSGVSVPEGIPETYIDSVSGKIYYYVESGVTDVNGRIIFKSQFLVYNPEIGFDCIYALVELKAPQGYILPSDPVTLFAFSEKDIGKSVTVIQTDNIIIFNKPIAPTSVRITGNKELSGITDTGKKFTFNAVQVDGMDSGTLTGSLGGSGTVTGKGTFAIDITGLEAGNEYYFMVTEFDESGVGWTYSENVFWVKVTVTDDGNGKAVAKITKTSGSTTFTNSYKTQPINVKLTGIKNLTGKILKDDMFSFTVKNKNGETVSTGTNKADGMITFGDIEFNAAGTYTYTVEETDNKLNGITYDSTKYVVTVTVVDKGNGTLKATANYPESGLVFNNAYKADSTSLVLTATKNTVGRDQTNGQFTFAVYEGTTVIATGTNNAAGVVTFSPINYTEAGNHTYTVRETSTDGNGWSTDAKEYTVNVTVTDNWNGMLTAIPDYTGTDVVFTNVYTTSGTSINLTATKRVTGASLISGQFNFEIYEGTTVVARGTNTAAGAISFSTINYTTSGRHIYTVRETSTGGNGWTTDTTVYTVTVNIADNGNGTLTATASYPMGGVVFTNTYTQPVETPTGNVNLHINKSLVDKDGNVIGTGKKFAVRLYDESMNMIQRVILTANEGEVVIEGLKSGTTYYMAEEDGSFTILGYEVIDVGTVTSKAIGFHIPEIAEGTTMDIRLRVNNLATPEELIDIPDDDVPLRQVDPPKMPEILDIPEPEIPLNSPVTGDNSNMTIMLGLCAASTFGLVLIIKRRRKAYKFLLIKK